MARIKRLTDDQYEQLDIYCNDLVIASEELRNYLNDVISKSNHGYIIVNAIKKQMEKLEETIAKLPDVVMSNNWEVYDNIDVDDNTDIDEDSD
jgi:hypothetical protein